MQSLGNALFVLFFSLCATAFAQEPKPEQKKEPLPPNVKCMKVATRLREGPNRTVTLWFRVPLSYDAGCREPCRVLVLFGGRNTDGVEDAKGRLGWGEWADKEGVFIGIDWPRPKLERSMHPNAVAPVAENLFF